MQLSDFQFPFDSSLVALHPARPRDHARLLSVSRQNGTLDDRLILDLPQLLHPGDLLVINDTRVIPARLVGTKHPSGGKVELLVLRTIGVDQCEVLIKGKIRVGQRIRLGQEDWATVVDRRQDRTIISLETSQPLDTFLQSRGQMPLPPYIKREPTDSDRTDYQTIFANCEGAIAAPTAGLHFTPRLLHALEARRIQVANITLHVGLGTFRPVTSTSIEDHRMESEWYEVPDTTAQAIARTKEHGGRIVAVGTTVMRSLESASNEKGDVLARQEQTSLFITPGYEFRVVDVLMTNFHLPGTTLLMLVSAFAGWEHARGAYEHAVKEQYRFYSYGDAMLIQ